MIRVTVTSELSQQWNDDITYFLYRHIFWVLELFSKIVNGRFFPPITATMFVKFERNLWEHYRDILGWSLYGWKFSITVDNVNVWLLSLKTKCFWNTLLKRVWRDRGDSSSQLQKRAIWSVYIVVHLLVFCKCFGNLTLTKEQIILKPLDGCFWRVEILEIDCRFLWPLSFETSLCTTLLSIPIISIPLSNENVTLIYLFTICEQRTKDYVVSGRFQLKLHHRWLMLDVCRFSRPVSSTNYPHQTKAWDGN